MAKNNVDQGIVVPQAAHAPQEKPFGHLQMDFGEGKNVRSGSCCHVLQIG